MGKQRKKPALVIEIGRLSTVEFCSEEINALLKKMAEAPKETDQ